MKRDYCGIVFVSGGSSWAYAGTKKQAVSGAVRRFKRDWSSLFDVKKGSCLKVMVLDMTGREGWYADPCGIFDSGTNEPITDFEMVQVAV